jgi:protein TonB
MNTREQFGNYLLLKKLADDSLGETFRAGRIGKSGMESVVLMRVFNGPSIDGQALWQKVSKRAAVQQRLKSPNIGDGVDLGEVRNVPFVAYDYVSGKNLGNLLEQASRKHTPIPTDHALLISERIALGLSVAYENKLDDQRILHGFLVPEMVMLSNEGETRLLGFEVGMGLRDFATRGSVAAQFGRYLAPETLAGQAAHKSDDCYSLGAILFELLTGQPLPMPAPPEGYGPLIDRSELANEGTPISPELASLIKRSLTGRAERVPDVVTWHKMLAKLMFDGQYNPTTFNLAFFMHNLFRDEIERESQEIEVEKTIKLPAAPPPAVPPPTAAPSASGAVRESTVSVLEQYGIEEKKKSNTPLIFGGIAAAIAIAVGAVMFLGGGKEEAPPPAAAAPAVPAGPTPEELAEQQARALAEQQALEAQIAKLVEERLKNLTENRAEQDKKLQDLQKQLEEARKAEEDRRRQIAEAQAVAAQKAAAPPPAETKPAEPQRPATAAVTPAQAAPSGPATAPITPAAPATAPTQAATAPASAPTATAPTAAVAVPVAPPTAATATTTVKRGDLVTDGPGVKKPAVLERVNPRYPPLAERMKKQADVTVRVLVDENGKVTQVEAKNDPGFGFADAAEDAARRSRFSAATKDGVPVKMWTEIKYSFKP